jgi:hypothetical protein
VRKLADTASGLLYLLVFWVWDTRRVLFFFLAVYMAYKLGWFQ